MSVANDETLTRQVNPTMDQSQLDRLNREFADKSPRDVITWALAQPQKTVVTTHFGPHEAVILHSINDVQSGVPVICVDHGYNTNQTYRQAQELTLRLGLQVHYYTPRVTRSRRNIVYGGIPALEDETAHRVFTEEVKLEPFARAMTEQQPGIWITGLRKEQTDHRASLEIFSWDKKFNCLKLSPWFFWTESQMTEYANKHQLPFNDDYFDPTKVLANRECGLHV